MTPEVKEEIILRMCEGRSLFSICHDEDMPHRGTVLRYLAREGPEHTEFRDRYARAILLRTNALAEQALEIAFDESHDFEERTNANGERYVALNATSVQRARLKTDELHWHIERLNGVKYGKPINVQTEAQQDRVINVTRVDFSSLPPEEIVHKKAPTLYREPVRIEGEAGTDALSDEDDY